MSATPIYKIIFQNQSNIIELHARELDIDSSYAFITVGDFVFGERSSIVVDPSEEQLKNEFAGVKPGDKVKLQLTPFDLSTGRLVSKPEAIPSERKRANLARRRHGLV